MGALLVLGAVSVAMAAGLAVSRGLLSLMLNLIPSTHLRPPGSDAP